MTLDPSKLSSCCESTGRGTLAESRASCPQRAEGPLPGEPFRNRELLHVAGWSARSLSV